jgi:hypothetical protein
VPSFGDEQFFLPSDLDLFDEDMQQQQEGGRSSLSSASLLGSAPPTPRRGGAVGDNFTSSQQINVHQQQQQHQQALQPLQIQGRSMSEDLRHPPAVQPLGSPTNTSSSDWKSKKLCRHFPKCTHPNCEFYHPSTALGGMKNSIRSRMDLTRVRSADVRPTASVRPWLLDANGAVRLPLKKNPASIARSVQRHRGYSTGDAELGNSVMPSANGFNFNKTQMPAQSLPSRKAPLLSMGESQLSIHRKHNPQARVVAPVAVVPPSSSRSVPGGAAKNKRKSPRPANDKHVECVKSRGATRSVSADLPHARSTPSAEWCLVETDRHRSRKTEALRSVQTPAVDTPLPMAGTPPSSSTSSQSQEQISPEQNSCASTSVPNGAVSPLRSGDVPAPASSTAVDAVAREQQEQTKRRKRANSKARQKKLLALPKREENSPPRFKSPVSNAPSISTASRVRNHVDLAFSFLLSCFYCVLVSHEQAATTILSDAQTWVIFSFSFALRHIYSALSLLTATASASAVCFFLESLFFLGLLFWLGHLYDIGHLVYVWMRSFRGVYLLARFILWSALGLQLWLFSSVQCAVYGYALYMALSKRGSKDLMRLASTIGLVAIAYVFGDGFGVLYCILCFSFQGIHVLGHNDSLFFAGCQK